MLFVEVSIIDYIINLREHEWHMVGISDAYIMYDLVMWLLSPSVIYVLSVVLYCTACIVLYCIVN